MSIMMRDFSHFKNSKNITIELTVVIKVAQKALVCIIQNITNKWFMSFQQYPQIIKKNYSWRSLTSIVVTKAREVHVEIHLDIVFDTKKSLICIKFKTLTSPHSTAIPSLIQLNLFAWTVQVPILKAETDGYKHKIQHEHRQPKTSVHLPPEAGDAEDDEEEHGKQEHDAADHAFGIDLDWRPVDQSVQQPRKR